ncbi:MAG: hypothetical protein H8E40_12065 [Chloroflexi bacterium]|nr:hypothetical protein [Chloroflexota bacterium]
MEFLEIVPFRVQLGKSFASGDWCSKGAGEGWQWLVVDVGLENISVDLLSLKSWRSDIVEKLLHSFAETAQGYTYPLHSRVGDYRLTEDLVAILKDEDSALWSTGSPYWGNLPPGFRSRLSLLFKVAENTSGYRLIVPEIGSYDLDSDIQEGYRLPYGQKPNFLMQFGEFIEIQPKVSFAIERAVKAFDDRLDVHVKIRNEGGYDSYAPGVFAVTRQGVWSHASDRPSKVGPGQEETGVFEFYVPKAAKHFTLVISLHDCEVNCVRAIEIDV